MRDSAQVRALWHQQPGLFRGYLVDLATASVLGVLTIIGGHDRVAGRAWVTLNASGGPYLWGSVLLFAAALLVAAAFLGPWVLQWAMLATAVVYGLFAWWFLTAALQTGVSFWGAVLCVHAVLTLVSRSDAYRAGPTS